MWPGSSLVERCPEEAGVGSSILPWATTMFYVYILQSERDGSYYTGMTTDVEKRLLQHNQSTTKTTRSKKPWRLLYAESHVTLEEARQRELYWKSGIGREERKKLQA